MWNLKCDTNEQTQTHRHRKQTYGYQRRKRVKRDKVRVRDNENVSCSLFETPWTVTYHVPLSKGFPGKNTGVGSHSLLQESSQPKDWAWVYCIADRFLLSEPSGKAKIHTTILFVVQSLGHVQLFAIPWTSACQTSLPFTVSWSLLKLMSIELGMISNHLILCGPLLFLPSIFLSIRVISWLQSPVLLYIK